MNNKVENPKKEINNINEFNDKDILQDLLNDEKNISNNLSIALNEMSNETLYDEVMNYFEDTKDSARILFDLMFKNGWYCLEKCEDTKLNEDVQKLAQEIKEIKK